MWKRMAVPWGGSSPVGHSDLETVPSEDLWIGVNSNLGSS